MPVVTIFYRNRPFALLILSFLVVVYVTMNFFIEHHLSEGVGNFGFWGSWLEQSSWLSRVLAPLLAFGNAILLNALFNRNDFMERSNFLPSMLYVTFLSFFHSFYFLDGFAIAQSLIIIALHQMFKLNQNEDARKLVFNLAFIFGVASTFYPLLLLAIPFLFWMIWVIRPFVLRESILAIIGFIIPLVYAGIYSSVFDLQIDNDHFSSSSLEMGRYELLILAGLIFILILLSLRALLLKVQQCSIRLKKLFRILLILMNFALILALVEYFFFDKKEPLSLVFITLMFILPYGFGYKIQRSITTFVFYLVLFFSVGKFLYPIAF